jgi:transposase
MTFHARDWFPVPDDTARVARKVYRKGNPYMIIRDKLGLWYQDSRYAQLFTSTRGHIALSPAFLNMVLIIQFVEGLTDRQVAEEVRGRIDLKYLLGMRLEDPGFEFTVLSEHRARLLAGGLVAQLFIDMLDHFKAHDLLKARGKQRTDSTHVLAAVRSLNRLERVGETMRAVLNLLAEIAPEWLRQQIEPDWGDLYGPRLEQSRLPKKESEREQLAIEIGADGYRLLWAIWSDTAPSYLRQLEIVETMRRLWIQQYYLEGDKVSWRTDEDSPPPGERIQSPYDPEARNRTKRDVNWTGYTVHLTETCDDEGPNLITDVQTTDASVVDNEVTPVIHQSLADKDLLPSEHYLDTGYVKAEHIVAARDEYGIDLVGPVMPDTSRQARKGLGFDQSCFFINWEAKQARCPEGQISYRWQERKNKAGKDSIYIYFPPLKCHTCGRRPECTDAEVGGRSLVVLTQPEYSVLQEMRQRQETEEFKERYKRRAGVEGTVSQGTRSFELRQTRYIGLEKTHLQHVLTALAMNVARVAVHLEGEAKAKTRQSRFQLLVSAA